RVMNKWNEPEEDLVYQGRIKVPYTWSVGEVGSRFFIELRDNKKIFGKRCPACKKVLVPARKVCGKCSQQTEEWVEVANQGTVQTFTVVRYPSDVQPLNPPFGYGIIKLDGADTGMAHLVYGSDPAKWKIGMKVKAVFKERREGNILDIAYFQPLVP
ncbi:MAG TPA: Zn-ribbon domain-containing OB-fold protein, partial [Thermodesulfobacteriota bacterium]|nr:Zn-ribbon domain-containing OB-fold protein [Thermodesulfobacteriota bacterium]